MLLILILRMRKKLIPPIPTELPAEKFLLEINYPFWFDQGPHYLQPVFEMRLMKLVKLAQDADWKIYLNQDGLRRLKRYIFVPPGYYVGDLNNGTK